MPVDVVDVHLLQLPVALYQAASLHQQALQREFDVISSAGSSESFPGMLLEVVRQLDERFGRFARPGYAELDEAVDQGEEEVDVTYRVPRDAAPAAVRLGELLDRADDYCRSGTHLLTLATPPECLRFRRWFLAQFVEQIAGRAPTPWPDWPSTDQPAGTPGAEHDDLDDARPDALPSGWSIERSDGRARVVLSGDLDFDTVSVLRSAMQQARERSAGITVDACAVTFIDSLAISVLIAARNRMVDERIELRVEAGPVVFRTLQIAGLTDALHVIEVPSPSTSDGSERG